MLGIIGGSGLSDFAELEIEQKLQVETEFGAPSSSIIIGKLAEQKVAFLARHGRPHSIAPHCVNYRANIKALQQIGVSHIIAVNAVGGISEVQNSQVLSTPHQLIDYTHGREHSFFDSIAAPLQHIDFTHPFDENLRQQILQAAKQSNIAIQPKAVCGVTQGPRLETAAEVKRLAQDGCDIVGMTSMPEAALARELELSYASISLVVNKAAGCTDELIEWPEIERNMLEGIAQVKRLLLAVAQNPV